MRKLSIVPIDVVANSAHKPVAYFDINLVPACTASVDLVQQLIELRCAASHLTMKQPSAKSIGLPGRTELLQSQQPRRRTGVLQIDACHVVQNGLRLRRMPRTAAKGLAK
jgi:hypothetical protein